MTPPIVVPKKSLKDKVTTKQGNVFLNAIVFKKLSILSFVKKGSLIINLKKYFNIVILKIVFILLKYKLILICKIIF